MADLCEIKKVLTCPDKDELGNVRKTSEEHTRKVLEDHTDLKRSTQVVQRST